MNCYVCGDALDYQEKHYKRIDGKLQRLCFECWGEMK